MKKWCTEIIAMETSTGLLKEWGGDTVEAPTKKMAQEWCDERKPYLKVTGELIINIPFQDGKPDWDKAVDFLSPQLN